MTGEDILAIVIFGFPVAVGIINALADVRKEKPPDASDVIPGYLRWAIGAMILVWFAALRQLVHYVRFREAFLFILIAAAGWPVAYVFARYFLPYARLQFAALPLGFRRLGMVVIPVIVVIVIALSNDRAYFWRRFWDGKALAIMLLEIIAVPVLYYAAVRIWLWVASGFSASEK